MTPETHICRLINPDGTETALHLAKNWSAAELLPVLQEAVGGYIEVVEIPFTGFVMIVDEEGKVKKKKTNSRAGTLAMRHIVGSVVVMKKSIWRSYND